MDNHSLIIISGSTRRTFLFPATLPDAFSYYRDIGRSLNYLRHITTVQHMAPDKYRLLYSAKEGALYRVKIFCDIQAEADEQAYRLRILPLVGKSPVRSSVRLNEMTCQGSYTSEIVFSEQGSQTLVQTSLEIRAELPKPRALGLIPHKLLSGAAHNIFLLRLDEVLNGFIEQSVQAYKSG